MKFAYNIHAMVETNLHPTQEIIFFDGECGFCNRAVNFLINKDKRRRFLFAPLSGETAKKLLNPSLLQMDTLVFFQKGKCFTYSQAILKATTGLGGVFLLFGIFFLIPYFIRDTVYRFIAKHRKKILPQSCLWDPSLSDRFLK